MSVNSNVRWFHSGMPGAPVLSSGTLGSWLAVLKACLIDGFGFQGVDGITVANGVATATLSAGNGFEPHAVVRIAGSGQAALNGDWRIKESSANSFSFDCPGVPDGVAGGSITVGLPPPAGWEMPFMSGNVGVFRSSAVGATGFCLQVDDSAQYKNLRGYESMTGISNGTDLFFSGFASFGSLNAQTRTWVLVADDRAFHFVGDFYHFDGRGPAVFFGDFIPVLSGDMYNCAVIGAGSQNSTPSNVMTVGYVGQDGTPKAARSFDGLTKAPSVTLWQPNLRAASVNDSANSENNLPAAALYGGDVPLVSRVLIQAPNTSKLARGFIPGYVAPGAFKSLGATNREVVAGQQGVYLLATGATMNSSYRGLYCFDIIGPWR